jgi:hypothetical protein
LANPTTNYGFVLPTPTDLVTDLPADFEVALQGVDTQMFTNANAAVSATVIDAKGDLLAGTAADTLSRIAIGANNTILTADSAEATGMKWAAAAAGGMTLISTTALTGASIVLTSIPATYKDLVLVIRNFLPAIDGYGPKLLLNGSTGNNYLTKVSNTASSSNNFAATMPFGENNQDNAVTQAFHRVQIYDYANGVTWKILDMKTAINNATTDTNVQMSDSMGVYNVVTAINSITILSQNGILNSGSALLYGVS